MNFKALAAVCLALGNSGALLFACGGDDTTFGADAGGPDGSYVDSPAVLDATPREASADAAPTPPWMLLSLNYSARSEMAAYSISGRRVDGTFAYPGKIGATFLQGATPYLMEQDKDLIVKLDPTAPWKAGGSWNVALDDTYDGGKAYADPVAVIAVPGNKAYVLRFNRNKIAVINTAQSLDAATPTSSIDLSSYLVPTDKDGHVDMTAAVYVAAKQRVYVLLGNVDLTNTDPMGFYTLCGSTKPIVIAIDVNTDTIVPFGDAGVGGIRTNGFNPVSMFYDAPRDRLLMVSAGCNNLLPGDAGVGDVAQRQIDDLVLTTGTTSTVLDLKTKDFPAAFAILDADHVAIGFRYGAGDETRIWDVTTALLGATIPRAPDVFAYDGKGSLLGPSTQYLSDGGSTSSLVSVAVADGGVTPLGPVPFTAQPSFAGGVDLWPAP